MAVSQSGWGGDDSEASAQGSGCECESPEMREAWLCTLRSAGGKVSSMGVGGRLEAPISFIGCTMSSEGSGAGDLEGTCV